MSTSPNDPWVVLNGQAMPASQARISPLGAGVQLGQGVYTSLRIAAGVPVFYARHHERLSADARAIGLEAPEASSLRARLGECIARNGLSEGALKVLLFKDVAGTSELVLTRPASPLARCAATGARLYAVRGPAVWSRTAVHKSIAYLPHLLARQEAAAAGFDEAVWTDAEGNLLECSGANVLALVDGSLLTPPVSKGLLPGVIRAVLLERCPGAREAELTPALLARAEALFITNSIVGLIPVRTLGSREWDLELPRAKAAELSALLTPDS